MHKSENDTFAFCMYSQSIYFVKRRVGYRVRYFLGTDRIASILSSIEKCLVVRYQIYYQIIPGEIQKSNGLKFTCLMSLYFKSEEDTMKNEIPAD